MGPLVPEGIPPQRCRLPPLRKRTARNGPGHSQARLGHRKQPEPCASRTASQGKGKPCSGARATFLPGHNTLTLQIMQRLIPEGTFKVSFSSGPRPHPVRWVGRVAFNHWENEGSGTARLRLRGGARVTTATCSQLSGNEDDTGGEGGGASKLQAWTKSPLSWDFPWTKSQVLLSHQFLPQWTEASQLDFS